VHEEQVDDAVSDSGRMRTGALSRVVRSVAKPPAFKDLALRQSATYEAENLGLPAFPKAASYRLMKAL
jgi:hypothetical protein